MFGYNLTISGTIDIIIGIGVDTSPIKVVMDYT